MKKGCNDVCLWRCYDHGQNTVLYFRPLNSWKQKNEIHLNYVDCTFNSWFLISNKLNQRNRTYFILVRSYMIPCSSRPSHLSDFNPLLCSSSWRRSLPKHRTPKNQIFHYENSKILQMRKNKPKTYINPAEIKKKFQISLMAKLLTNSLCSDLAESKMLFEISEIPKSLIKKQQC